MLQIDYGCYVNLMKTTKEPKGLLALDDRRNGVEQYVEVRQTTRGRFAGSILRLA